MTYGETVEAATRLIASLSEKEGFEVRDDKSHVVSRLHSLKLKYDEKLEAIKKAHEHDISKIHSYMDYFQKEDENLYRKIRRNKPEPKK